MKKLFFSLIAFVFFASGAIGQSFEKSVALIAQGRVAQNSSQGNSAKTFKAINFNPNYQLESSYGINGVDYTDDGRNYDVKANDQIYTSVILTKNPSNSNNSTDLNVFLSQEFEHHTQLNTYAVQAKLIIRVRCKIRHTFTGSTILGFSCSKPPGCIEFYDCEAEIEWEW